MDETICGGNEQGFADIYKRNSVFLVYFSNTYMEVLFLSQTSPNFFQKILLTENWFIYSIISAIMIARKM